MSGAASSPGRSDPRRSGSTAMAVLRVTSGNFLEMYDFIVFGFYAGPIGHAFFPSHDPFVSLMASFATFWAAFLMRPLGALVLGAYLDRRGRRAGLILTLALMAVGTLTLAVMPSYARIGLVAPVLVLLGRLLQGFSAGVELGGVSVFLAEIAPPGARGLFVSWQSASQQVAVMAAAALGAVLNHLLSPGEMQAWGWRIPLLAGCLIVPVLLLLRRGMTETPVFEAIEVPPSTREILRTLRAGAASVLIGAGLVAATTVSFYLITVYTPTFGRSVLHLPAASVLVVTFCVGLSNLLWLPVSGALSDRIGRVPILLATTILMLLLPYPLLSWATAAPSLGRLLAVELVLSVLYGFYNGAMVVYLIELVPPQARSAGFSLAYSLAVAVFGGATPLLCTWAIHATGNPAMPGLWMSLAALVGLVATLASRARPGSPLVTTA